MKKTMLYLSLFGLLSFSNYSLANDEQLFQTLCASIKDNDRNMLRKTLDSGKLRIRTIFEGLKCNGQDMVEFALENKSTDVAIMIIKQLPKQIITEGKYIEKAQSIGSSELLDTIKSRTE